MKKLLVLFVFALVANISIAQKIDFDKKLKELGSSLTKKPENFNLNSKVTRLLEGRQKMILEGKDIDWGMAETMLGRHAEAMTHYRHAAVLNPNLSTAWRSRDLAVDCRINVEGPSKYEFEGPSHGSARPPPDFSGRPRYVQIAALMPRFRSIGDVVFASSTRSLPTGPASTRGSSMTSLSGRRRRLACTSWLDPHLAVR